MKIIVTGANGFIGSHLVPYLIENQHQVACLLREHAKSYQLPSKAIFYQVNDSGQGIREAMQEFKPDLVVHLAALYIGEHRYEDIPELINANLRFGTYILEAMRLSGCSDMVYTGSSWQHYNNHDYCPVNLYAATKQAFSTIAKFYLDAFGFKLLELHLYESYGEYDSRKKVLKLLNEAASSGKEVLMSKGGQLLHFVHIDDICSGISLACEHVNQLNKSERRVYRLPSKEPVSLRKFVEIYNNLDVNNAVQVRWEMEYKQREVLNPWGNAEVLPGWAPKIALLDGLRRVRYLNK